MAQPDLQVQTYILLYIFTFLRDVFFSIIFTNSNFFFKLREYLNLEDYKGFIILFLIIIQTYENDVFGSLKLGPLCLFPPLSSSFNPFKSLGG